MQRSRSKVSQFERQSGNRWAEVTALPPVVTRSVKNHRLYSVWHITQISQNCLQYLIQSLKMWVKRQFWFDCLGFFIVNISATSDTWLKTKHLPCKAEVHMSTATPCRWKLISITAYSAISQHFSPYNKSLATSGMTDVAFFHESIQTSNQYKVAVLCVQTKIQSQYI